jgi:hypothetical protein
MPAGVPVKAGLEASWLAFVLCAGILQACATAPAQAPAPFASTEGSPPDTVAGVWEGTSVTGCSALQPDPTRCNAVSEIELTMLDHHSEITGFYRCATGTMVCRNLNETGVITNGGMHGKLLSLRVMMPDGSSCLFDGIPSKGRMAGNYLCLQGGGFVEQGRWQAQKSY